MHTIVSYENKPVPSGTKDFWKGRVTEKGKKNKQVIKRQGLSHQDVNIIVQYISSNYVSPSPKKKG